jgi:hypothetical protein
LVAPTDAIWSYPVAHAVPDCTSADKVIGPPLNPAGQWTDRAEQARRMAERESGIGANGRVAMLWLHLCCFEQRRACRHATMRQVAQKEGHGQR